MQASARSLGSRPYDYHIDLSVIMSDTQTYHDHERMSAAVEHAMHHNKHKNSNKRKRDPSDQDGNEKHSGPRPAATSNMPGNHHDNGDLPHGLFTNDSNSNDFSHISQELARHVAGAMPSTAAAALAASMPQLTVPRPTELSFPSNGPDTDAERQLDSSFDMGGGSDGDQNHQTQGASYNLSAYQGDSAAQGQAGREIEGVGGSKPAVGSDEWHKVRRDNHKEGKECALVLLSCQRSP